jgi:hypothetical protein
VKPRIPYTQPSITELEVRYATDAAVNGWGERCYASNGNRIATVCNEHRTVLRIPDGEALDGTLPNKQMKLVQAWIAIHQEDLMADWQLASEGQTPFRIDPLR